MYLYDSDSITNKFVSVCLSINVKPHRCRFNHYDLIRSRSKHKCCVCIVVIIVAIWKNISFCLHLNHLFKQLSCFRAVLES